jgi:hypothetical protein
LYDNYTAYANGYNFTGWQSIATVWSGTSYCGLGAYPVAATDGYIDLKI